MRPLRLANQPPVRRTPPHHTRSRGSEGDRSHQPNAEAAVFVELLCTDQTSLRNPAAFRECPA